MVNAIINKIECPPFDFFDHIYFPHMLSGVKSILALNRPDIK